MESFLIDGVPITHDRDSCFLCGVALTRLNRSKEHVFPEWLLHAFDLWNEQFTLPTGQRRQYRKLVIPCCSRCNNEALGRVESQIRRGVTGGYDAFRRLPKRAIYQWLAKILYEVLYLDAGHLVDPAHPELGRIREPIDLERFRNFFGFLQSVRLDVRFARQAPPWSMFIFQTETYETPRQRFDYADNPEVLTIALRMNDIGIVACLEDNGGVRQALTPFFRKLRRHPVTDAQFQEVVARMFYATNLRTYTPTYLRIGNNPTTVFAVPPSGLSSVPPFRPWVFPEYGAWLAHYTHQPYDECFIPPDGAATTLLRFRNFFN